MGLVLKIAFRNLFRHVGKSFVIGTILFIGAMFMSIGNGVITGLENGIEKNIIDSSVGDITLLSARQKEDNIMQLKPIKVISNFDKIKNVLETQDYIDKFLPITRGLAINLDVSLGNEMGDPGFSILYGMDFDKFQIMFDNSVKIIEGRALKPGERGLLLNISDRKRIFQMDDIWILPKGYPLVKENLTKEALSKIDTLKTRNDMVLMGMGDGYAASDVRLPIIGVYKFKSLNRIMERLNLVDLESFRECFDYVTSADKAIELSDTTKNLLKMEDEDLADIFAEESQVIESQTKNSVYDFKNVQKQVKVKDEKKSLNLDTGAYNLISIRLKDGINPEEAVKELNNTFQSTKVDSDVRAVLWKDSFGYLADFILFFRLALTILVNFIFFVAIVVIINTLSMAAMERIYEIGMMRAVGARKGFVGKMFFAEISLLSLLFGSMGMIFGTMIVFFLAALKIPATGPMMQMAFGGDTFHPMLDLQSIILGIIQLTVVTLIAMVYPIILARRITPLDAINRE